MDFNMNFYEILGITSGASKKEIRRAYYSLCSKYHPDKMKNGQYSDENFMRIQNAYKTLMDDVKRILYDINIYSFTDEEINDKMASVQKIQYNRLKDYERKMFDKYEKIKAKEEMCNGLVILKALYGLLTLKIPSKFLEYETTIGENELTGPFFDVTISLQCQVENSTLLIHGKNSSTFEDVEGIFSPIINQNNNSDNCLYVLYSFQNKMHETTTDDCGELALPLKKHLIISNEPRGPFCPKNIVDFTGSPTEGSNWFLSLCNHFGLEKMPFSINRPIFLAFIGCSSFLLLLRYCIRGQSVKMSVKSN